VAVVYCFQAGAMGGSPSLQRPELLSRQFHGPKVPSAAFLHMSPAVYAAGRLDATVREPVAAHQLRAPCSNGSPIPAGALAAEL